MNTNSHHIFSTDGAIKNCDLSALFLIVYHPCFKYAKLLFTGDYSNFNT